MTQEQIAEVFKRTGVMQEGHFLLTSGRHSDIYMQCARLFEYPEDSGALCAELAKKMRDVDVDMVISPAVGGVIMGYEMARALKAKNIFAERQEGAMALRRGFAIPEGARVVVAEDVITTGGTVKEVIELARRLGGNPVGVCSMVDRSNGGVDFGIPFYPLIAMEVKSYAPEDCPLCAQGSAAIKPGSRGLK